MLSDVQDALTKECQHLNQVKKFKSINKWILGRLRRKKLNQKLRKVEKLHLPD